jgi:L-fuculose-phosphate aldolase
MSHAEKQRLLEELRDAGARLDALGLVPARDGNLSARLGRDRILITATGVRKRSLTPGDFAEIDLAGRPLAPSRPSTEAGLHRRVYELRPDVGSVVHAHPPVAVGFASAGLGLTDCLVPEVVVNLGAVPLTPYARPGTPEIEAAITDAARTHDAFLLANHGAVTLGATVGQALDRMETLEHFARIALVARLLGGARPLSREAAEALLPVREAAGNLRPLTCAPAGEPPLSGAVSSPPAPSEALGTPAAAPPGLADLVARVVREVLAGRSG